MILIALSLGWNRWRGFMVQINYQSWMINKNWKISGSCNRDISTVRDKDADLGPNRFPIQRIFLKFQIYFLKKFMLYRFNKTVMLQLDLGLRVLHWSFARNLSKWLITSGLINWGDTSGAIWCPMRARPSILAWRLKIAMDRQLMNILPSMERWRIKKDRFFKTINS